MNDFYSFMNRMKYINRWGLMNCARSENVTEHSMTTAMLAHTLALLQNKLTLSTLNADRVGMLGLFHEAAEVITGDLPTPVKYFNEKITSAYKEIESHAENIIASSVPDILKEEMSGYIKQDRTSLEGKIVKAADKLSALIKCAEECALNNSEFKKAFSATEESLVNMDLACVDYFLKEIFGGYNLSLDECF